MQQQPRRRRNAAHYSSALLLEVAWLTLRLVRQLLRLWERMTDRECPHV
jgi:hypothetical protein